VRFTAYADSSINLELLIWIKVRKTARCKERSTLYVEIFEAFDKRGDRNPAFPTETFTSAAGSTPDPPKPERLHCDGALRAGGSTRNTYLL
jgi:small-conductance mechanosensitive channel